ncbi:hypothetical protein I302_104247 [Kwoniella bestiolae CBS 10118]|uniref:Alpha-type protein kinase domain-containing protein n=1 Tax=Kwoniella bestiolae CBS 10118 TaxID=1296100 RepID=A0A1B9GAR8_9TREE|nr:hypothetical protein I302_02956 [Kwoniella bestiolae CBS 10118]OCF28105.1 hypothetical protein I302_02956 [Kwoniella bestiolae CBS 10118]
MPTRPPPEWLPSITQVEFIIDEEAFIQIANHCFDFEGTYLLRHPAPVGPPIAARIKVGKAIGIGSLWDVYQAKIYLTSSKNPQADCFDVIVKYTSCMDFDGDRYFSDDASNVMDRKSALKAVKNDHEFYTMHLSDLQGTVIPVHYGTFIEPQLQVCCMILEDVGTPIGKTTSLGFIDDQDK